MYARCPHCHTVFALEAEHLAAAQGWVRCGHCRRPFDALTSTCELAGDSGRDAPSAPATPAPLAPEPEPAASQPAAYPPGLADVAEERIAQPVSLDDQLPGSPATAQAVPAVPEALQADLRRAARSPRRLRLVVQPATVLLLLVLALFQYAWFQPRELLQRLPALRPWLEGAYARLDRPLPPPVDLEQVRLLSRAVRDHPTYALALQVSLTLVNEAAFVQPFPRLRLSLFDVNGGRIASRVFQPATYLDAAVSAAAGMPVGQPVQVRLDLLAPETPAVSYEFEFL